MSFLDSLGDLAKSAGSFLTSGGIGSSLARTALLGFALNRMQNSVNKKNDAVKNQGSRVQLAPDTETCIPVVYGDAFVAGKVIDAVLSDNNSVLWVCLAICEQTGNMINGTASEISIEEVYWDGLKLEFLADGSTVDKAFDEDGNSVDWSGLIRVFPYSGDSDSPVNIGSLAAGNTDPAYSLMPGWTANHDMSDLVFALLRITYNSEKSLTTLGNVQFKVSNTMKKPGDVLNDYMQNERYGAGIPAAEINIS